MKRTFLRRSAGFVAVPALLLVGVGDVAASPFEMYGAGQRGRAMGAQGAKGEGGFSLVYNPASLSMNEGGFQIGGFASFDATEIQMAPRPTGYETEENIGTPENVESGDPLFGVEFALNLPTFVDGLNLGAAIFMPTNELMKLNTHYADEREAQSSNQLTFELTRDRIHRPDIQLAASYRVVPWLSFGIGGSFIPGAIVGTDVYLSDPSDQENIDLNASVSTETRWGVSAGAVLNFDETLLVGLSFKSETAFEIEGQNRIKINEVDEDGDTRQTINWVPLFSPAQARFGASWTTKKTTLALDWTYTFWSSFRDTQNQEVDFRDTVSGHAGIEYAYSPETNIRGGFGFEPTPVPDQIDRTNYVDNHRAIFRVGSSHNLKIVEKPITFGWSAQAHLMLARETLKRQQETYAQCADGVKTLCDEAPDTRTDRETGETVVGSPGLQTSNPGFPGWSSGGWFAAISAEVLF